MGHTTQDALSGLVIFQQSHPDDAYALGPSLRLEDAEEVYICSTQDGRSNSEYLEDCIAESGECFSILDTKKRMLGVWGHGPWSLNSIKAQGYVWLVACDELFDTKAKTMTRIAKDYFLPELDTMYPGGYGNLVKATNSVHLRWLKALGFEDQGEQTIRGHEFRLLWRGR